MFKSLLLEFGGMAIGGSTTLHSLMEGNLIQAALIPTTGYGIKKIGDCYQIDTISSLGFTIIQGSLFSLPITPICYTIQVYTESSMTAKIASSILTLGLIYKAVDYLIESQLIAVLEASSQE